MSEFRERQDEEQRRRHDEGIDPWGYDEYAPASLDASPFDTQESSADIPAALNVPLELRCARCGHTIKPEDELGCPECAGTQMEAA